MLEQLGIFRIELIATKQVLVQYLPKNIMSQF